jgi:hypothetical protein
MRLDDSDGDNATRSIFEADIFKVAVLHNAISFGVRRITVLLNLIFQKIMYDLHCCTVHVVAVSLLFQLTHFTAF